MKYDLTKYFPCYSPNLKEYLELNGFLVYDTFKHVRTLKICWMFERTDKLPLYLEQWSSNRKNKG